MVYSKVKMMGGAADWNISRDYFDPIYNYLIYGYSPGSFFTALLCNDFFHAIGKSHPSNSISSLKNLTGWIRSLRGHNIFWGNIDVVNSWLKLSDQQRREALEKLNIIYSEKDEVVMALQNHPIREVVLY